jgi:hypothetical protein
MLQRLSLSSSRGNGSDHNIRLQRQIKEYASFDIFVHRMLSWDLIISHRIFWPQKLFTHHASVLQTDFVFKQETFINDTDFKAISANFPKKIPQINTSGKSGEPLNMSESTYQKIVQLYECDFISFNYGTSYHDYLEDLS